MTWGLIGYREGRVRDASSRNILLFLDNKCVLINWQFKNYLFLSVLSAMNFQNEYPY